MAAGSYREEDEITGKGYDHRLMRRLVRYIYPYKKKVFLSFLLLLCVAMMELAGPYLTKVAIDDCIKANNPSLLLKVCLAYFCILLFAFVLGYLQIFLMQYVGQKTMCDMRLQLFTHLQKCSLSFFDKNPVGRLITRTTTDVEVLNEMLSAGVVTIFGDIITLLGIMVVLLWLDLKLALITFIVIPLLFVITTLFRKKVRDSYRDIRKWIARINAYMQENITGISVVQLFNREEKNYQKFASLNRGHLEAFLRTIFYYSVFFPAVEIASALAIALIVWYGGFMVHDKALTLGALVAFIQYANRFFRPIRDLSEKYNIMQSAMASSERIFKLLDTVEEIPNAEAPIPLKDVAGEIKFENVWFAYKDQDWVLRDVSFHVKRGEKIALVGATGAGKSSMISILSRFYDIQKGKILVDGKDIKDLDKYHLRKHIGIVLQDVFLFSGSIEENIRLGNPLIDEDKIRRAASYANADGFIEKLEEGYQFDVRERGNILSGGQKQLLAFARVLAYSPRILILDEATSSIDTETEILIQDALKKLMADRTSLIIAHRLSTIQNVDKIIVLHKGEVKEIGTHQELLKQGGIYYHLYQLQYKDQEILRGDVPSLS